MRDELTKQKAKEFQVQILVADIALPYSSCELLRKKNMDRPNSLTRPLMNII